MELRQASRILAAHQHASASIAKEMNLNEFLLKVIAAIDLFTEVNKKPKFLAYNITKILKYNSYNIGRYIFILNQLNIIQPVGSHEKGVKKYYRPTKKLYEALERYKYYLDEFNRDLLELYGEKRVK